MNVDGSLVSSRVLHFEKNRSNLQLYNDHLEQRQRNLFESMVFCHCEISELQMLPLLGPPHSL
jgi:hypothetical protein